MRMSVRMTLRGTMSLTCCLRSVMMIMVVVMCASLRLPTYRDRRFVIVKMEQTKKDKHHDDAEHHPPGRCVRVT